MTTPHMTEDWDNPTQDSVAAPSAEGHSIISALKELLAQTTPLIGFGMETSLSHNGDPILTMMASTQQAEFHTPPVSTELVLETAHRMMDAVAIVQYEAALNQHLVDLDWDSEGRRQFIAAVREVYRNLYD